MVPFFNDKWLDDTRLLLLVLLIACVITFMGCSAAPPEVQAGHAQSIASLGGYVGNVEGMLVHALDLYREEGHRHADYRRDTILALLEGKDPKKDVEIALEAERTHQAAYQHIEAQIARAKGQLAEVRLDLTDHLVVQEELAKYLAAAGVDRAMVEEVVRLVASLTAKRFFEAKKE